MSKVLKAKCVGKVVTYNGTPVNIADIISEGNGQSEGLLILTEDKAYYIPSNAKDIGNSIEKINQALTKIANALTSIGGRMTGPTTSPPPTLPTDVAEIQVAITELNAIKEMLS